MSLPVLGCAHVYFHRIYYFVVIISGYVCFFPFLIVADWFFCGDDVWKGIPLSLLGCYVLANSICGVLLVVVCLL